MKIKVTIGMEMNGWLYIHIHRKNSKGKRNGKLKKNYKGDTTGTRKNFPTKLVQQEEIAE